MARQSLDLGLSLGLGLVSQSQGSFWYSGGNVAPDVQEVGPPPAAATEEYGTCSPGSPMSSGSGMKRGAERSAGSGDEDQDDDGGNARKKLRLSKDQAAVLEECFKTHHTLTPKQKLALANSLGLRPRQVEVWFQNRRARTKLKQTEVDCEYMKRWCEQLAEQNKRLEKEVAELRALKAAPSATAQQASPAATLTMCPSCRRVASTAASGQAATPQQQHPSHHQQQQCHPKSNAQAASAAGNVLSSHCQFFPATADRATRQQATWNGAAQPLVTRELF